MTPTDAQREAAGQTRHVVWLNPGSVRHLASDQLPWPAHARAAEPPYPSALAGHRPVMPTDEQLLAEELAAAHKHTPPAGRHWHGPTDPQGNRIPPEQAHLLRPGPSSPGGFVSGPVQTLGDQVTEDAHFRQHPLYQAFKEAWRQATSGKGQRHGGDATPFYAQSWRHIADAQGPGFLVGQAEKKLHEAGTRVQTKPKDCSEPLPQVGDYAWQREVLGALVYGGMAWLHATGKAKEGGHG